MRTARTIGIYVLIAIVLFFFFFPIYWMITTSIKSVNDIFAVPPRVVSFEPTFDNYTENFDPRQPRNKLRSLVNSVIITILNAALATSLGAAIAYGVTTYDFRGKERFLFWILSLRILPPIAFAVPFFLAARKLGLLDTHVLLIVLYCLFNVPLAVWLLRSFFREVPKQIREAAIVDGAGEFQVFSRLIVPLAAPGIVVTFLFSAIFAWNEFLLALVLTRNNARTIPVSVTSFWSTMEINWGGFASVGTVMFIPIMILALLLQKWLVRGLTFGAVKS